MYGPNLTLSLWGSNFIPKFPTRFNEMKIRHTHRFLIYKISDDKTTIELEKEGDKEKTYDDFLAAMPENQPRSVLVL